MQQSPESTPSPRTTALNQRHADLDAQLHKEMLKAKPDTLLIQSLKKQKLAIKDQLTF